MRRTLQSGLLLGLSALAAAVFKDEVGDIDFHYSLVGLPQVETTFFHRPRKEDKASLLYTLSDIGILGAVNPSNGDLVWRHQIADDASPTSGGFLRAPEGENWVAAAYGSSVQAWSALTGRNLWRVDFKGEVKDLEILELTEASRKDVLALFDEDGVTVLRRLHGALGTVVWEFREHSNDLPLQVSNNIANVYVVSLHGSPSSYSLKVTSLETATGTRVNHVVVGAKGDIHGPGDVMFVGSNSAAPIVAWTNQGSAKLNVNVLGSKSKQDFNLPPDTASVQIHAPHLTQSQTHFLVHTRSKGEKTNKAMVFHTDLKTRQIKLAYELPAFRGHGAFCTSSEGANVYFAQISSDETLIVSSESHGILARWPNNRAVDISPVHAAAEVIKKPGGQEFAVRSAVVTNSGDWALLRNGEKDWTRHEGLSGAVAAVWAEIPEGEDLAKVLAQEAHTNPLAAYIHRVTRHIDDLKYLPRYLASIPERVVNSIAGGDLVGHKEGLRRDTFGFNKILVVVTRRGRFYGLDSGNHGQVLWTHSWFPRDTDTPLIVKGLVSDDEHGIVAMYGAGGEYAAFNASSGVAREVLLAEGEKPGVSCTAVVEGGSGTGLLPIGNDDLPTRDLPADWDSEQTVVVRGEGETLKGIRFSAEGGKVTKQEMWQLQMRPGLEIEQIVTPPAHDPVASIGRVLGDRRVLYKYLNTNSIVVAATNGSANALSVQLVDTASGQVLTSQLYKGVDSRKSISCTMAENWYACSFFGDYMLDDDTERSLKGYQVVVTDLYESPEPNSRGPLGDAANFSSLDPVDNPVGGLPLPWALSQAYVVSQPLTHLAVTQTRQGISTRELVAYLPHAHGILGLSRHVLDPRRPVGRDPTAAEMEAEALMRYAPAFEIDPRTVLSHERDVAGIRGLVTAAAVVESTSLLAAYGVDVYVARVAPSGVFDILGRGFNKVTLVATVLALSGGVMFLAPMVRRKQIDRRWQAFL
ncbi:PQQ-like domain-containing protein [Hirsutella rhossiliensis]|uniref:ER membrane protein complex subunit 1 n=1 Tax=Hirsutella rhossiliensis TaxID=111463 RepID=A0A9P8MVI6_9HYPO|nr:PQQ-like domain-containing protein [Hirsutella rhossiliensis]KAH0961807.1 PQQ-like domain-containing protein [Hirsutella rhossiliensis]